jgi:SulP family sulfate permease
VDRSARAQRLWPTTALVAVGFLVVQLQGHLFLANMAQLSPTSILCCRSAGADGGCALIVIMDFGLVLGIDTSAAQAIVKLKNTMQSSTKLSCASCFRLRGWVPTEFDLTRGLSASASGGTLPSSSSTEQMILKTASSSSSSRRMRMKGQVY